MCSHAFESIRVIDRSLSLQDIPFKCAIECICYTPQEVQHGLDQGNLTIIEMLQDGQILYENGNFFKFIRDKFDKARNSGIIQKIVLNGTPQWFLNF